jgi:hypothetical protein
MDLAHELGHGPDAAAAADPRNFSIVLGGPLYQVLRRAHMSGDALELARRRILAIAAVSWLPLLLLSIAAGTAWDGGVAVPFIMDAQAHTRFLVAVPLLVAAELLVHMRLRPVAGEFVARGLVPEDSLPRFRECLRSAFRLRNSIAAELLMIALVYGVGVPFLWRYYAALDVDTWYALRTPEGARLTPAGFWYVCVSVPLFQFLLLRWYFRLAIWIRFLWQVSRIRLLISAMHGDQAGGLGFLNGTVYAFVPLLMAHGALLAGVIANRVFFAGATLMDSRVEIAAVVVILVAAILLPLTVFAWQVNEAKRRGSRIYGRLAQRYVRDFEARWLPDDVPARDSPLGSGDIQSLADIANSLATVRATRPIPITRQAVVQLALAVLVPLAPLLLTVIPAEELLKRLLKLLI